MKVLLPQRIVPLAHASVPLFVTTVFSMSLFPPPPSTVTVLLLVMVTTALSQLPATQFKAPLMTLLPTRLPAFSTTLLPVAVPLMLKPPAFRYIVPTPLLVMEPPVKLPLPCNRILPVCALNRPLVWLNRTPPAITVLPDPADLRTVPKLLKIVPMLPPKALFNCWSLCASQKP